METAPMNMPAPKFEASRSALLALIAVNLIPLLGVLQWDWSVFEIVFLYWCENLIFGLITVLKMLSAFPDINEGGMTIEVPAKGGKRKIPLPTPLLEGKFMLIVKLFLVPFFIFHYGMFCMGHGIFIFAIFSEESFTSSDVWMLDELIAGPLLIACGALLLSHLYSFLANYIGRGEFRRTNPMSLMMSPYKRIVVLHLTIIAGGGVSLALGSPFWLLALLIGLKILMDVRAHLQEHRSFAANTSESDTDPNHDPTIISNLA
jgi:hypothetical protein